MRLLNTNTVFPGGWRYNQNDATGKLLRAFKSMSPYNSFLDQILVFRVGNKLPRATKTEVDEDIQEYMCKLVGGDGRFCYGPGSKKNYSFPLQHRAREAVVHAANAVYSLSSGARILADWLGEGMPHVPVSEAQNRADVCGRGQLWTNKSGIRCPHNRSDADFSAVTKVIANVLREQMQKKNELKLSVEGESELKTCAICLCDLKLKVWVPMKTILDRTSPTVLQQFNENAPANCWMRTQQTP